MSFLGGAECSTAANPLTHFKRHDEHDNSLHRDRQTGIGSLGLEEGIRSRMPPNGADQMFEEFLQSRPPPIPFTMSEMRTNLPEIDRSVHPEPALSWAAEFKASQRQNDQMEFGNHDFSGHQQHPETHFNPAEFQASSFPKPQANGGQVLPQSHAFSTHSPLNANMYRRPMGIGYLNGMQTGVGMGMGMQMGMQMPMPRHNQMPIQQHTFAQPSQKGKERLVELDDAEWEAQFAAIEKSQQEVPSSLDKIDQDIDAELDKIDRSVQPGTSVPADFEAIWQSIQAERDSRNIVEDDARFGNSASNDDFLSAEDLKAWENFDSNLPLNTHSDVLEGDLPPSQYMFEAQNPFLENPNLRLSAFEQGVQILKDNGNFSLAALAFEAAVQVNPEHAEAWTLLGSSQAQNEKETPAIRAYERALQIDPNNLDSLMGLAVSYINEGYESTAYITLERWLSVKYPQILPPDQVSTPSEHGFTARAALHEKITNHFIRAAQLSPSGPEMDPDVQVGLGVLCYGRESYDKAIDCFTAALGSTVEGSANRKGQVHLLWNRLGATLANSGHSEDAISAYEQALIVNPNFVRARYNLGVSCINIGCYPEAAQHLLGALSMHRISDQRGVDKAREIVGDGSNGKGKGRASGALDDETLEKMIQQNESSNLYDTLRKAFNLMKRRDLSDKVGAGMDLDALKAEFGV